MSQPLPPYRPHDVRGVCSTCGVPHGAPPHAAPKRPLHQVMLAAVAIPFGLAMCVVTPVMGFTLARGVARAVVPLARFGPRALTGCPYRQVHRARLAPAYVRPAQGYIPPARRAANYVPPCGGVRSVDLPIARPVDTDAVPQPAYAPAPGSMLAQAGPFSLNRWELVRRARALVAGGAPVRLRELSYSTSAARAAAMLAPTDRLVPHYRSDGTSYVRVWGVTPNSPFGRIGLRSGDVISAINGRGVFNNDPESGAYAPVGSRSEPNVIEVIRNNRDRWVFVTYTAGAGGGAPGDNDVAVAYPATPTRYAYTR